MKPQKHIVFCLQSGRIAGATKVISAFLALTLCLNPVVPLTVTYANEPASVFNLPSPGSMVMPSAGFIPPMLKGMKVDLQRPFQFDFILDSGNAELTQKELKQEANKLIKYFLASLTIPEDDLWVNLGSFLFKLG